MSLKIRPLKKEQEKPFTQKGVFRYNKKYNVVELFYYNTYSRGAGYNFKDITCFCLSEGHSTCSYEHYLSCKPVDLNDASQKAQYDRIKWYYESAPIHTVIIDRKRLNATL